MYLVKGYIKKEDSEELVCKTFLAESATSCEDALAIASHYNIVDVVAVSLSKIKEVLSADGENYYVAVVEEENLDSKTLKYEILTAANSFDKAKEIFDETLKQGYNMMIHTIKKSNIYAVI